MKVSIQCNNTAIIKTHNQKNTMLQKLNKSRGGFTLVEIMIVVAIIALLAAIAVPNFLRARKRSQATRILNDLRLIDSAMDQYAIETQKTSGFTPTFADIQNYLKTGTVLYTSALTSSRYLRPLHGGFDHRGAHERLRCPLGRRPL